MLIQIIFNDGSHISTRADMTPEEIQSIIKTDNSIKFAIYRKL